MLQDAVNIMNCQALDDKWDEDFLASSLSLPGQATGSIDFQCELPGRCHLAESCRVLHCDRVKRMNGR
jgi:hypothetical protein